MFPLDTESCMASNEDLMKKYLRSKAEPEKWMAWLLAFCRRDLRKCTREDWNSIRRDIHQLCHSSSAFDLPARWRGSLVAASPQAGAEFAKGVMTGLRNKTDLVAMQRILKEGLMELYPEPLPEEESEALRIWELPASVPTVCIMRMSLRAKQRIRKKDLSRFYRPGGSLLPTLRFFPKWPGLFWFAVAEIIGKCGPRLRQCEECKRLFVKTGRQAYCREACSQKVRSRKWYKDHVEKIKKERRMLRELVQE